MQDAPTLMREAQALKAAGRLEEAISRYREAIAANPRSAVAEHNLSACLGDAGRWADDADLAPHRRRPSGRRARLGVVTRVLVG